MSKDSAAHPPEWWTEENTAKWQAEVWGGSVETSAAQHGWRGKLTQDIARGKFPPPTAKQYREWAKNETRAPAVHFFDGTVDPKRLALVASPKQKAA